MDRQNFVTQLLALPTLDSQEQFLKENASLLADHPFADEIATALKGEVDQLIRQNVSRSLEVVELIFLFAKVTQNPLDRALGLLAKGNVKLLGQGLYQEALDVFDNAFQLYDAHNKPIYQARIMTAKVFILSNLGHYEEANSVGESARQRFIQHNQWQRVAGLNINVATNYMRLGQDQKALTLLDEAATILRQIEEQHTHLPFIEQNRATSLRHLGQFQAAIQASQAAYQALTEAGQLAEAMRARQNLALTYFVLGRYNESLQILEEVRDFFLQDDRQRDAIMVELFISDGLLYLRRFSEVIQKCQEVQERFTERGLTIEVAQALLNQAKAYAGLAQDGRLNAADREAHEAKALALLTEAQNIFEAAENDHAVMLIKLERAIILSTQGKFQESLSSAQTCIGFWQGEKHLLEEARADLVAAQAAIHLEEEENATAYLEAALTIAEDASVPTIRYQCHVLYGDLARQQGQLSRALDAYDEAIEAFELLKGRLMVEFRIDFAAHHQTIYEKAVAVCLELEQFAQGLEYAERAKSRALLDLLAQRLDLSIQARQESDRPLVEELRQLQAERDRLYRRLQSDEGLIRTMTRSQTTDGQIVRQDIVAYEEKITQLWQRLLIRNADYARDAVLWQGRTEPVAQYLPEDTLLLEYFTVDEQLLVFIVSAEEIQVNRLYTKLATLEKWMDFFRINRQWVVSNIGNPKRLSIYRQQAEGILGKLYQSLVAPFAEQLAPYKRLIIVPHRSLHHLPFHALYDGQLYLLEKYEISYLPNASVLPYCQPPAEYATHAVSLGYSNQQQLPHTVSEAQEVANIMQGQAYIEEEATSDCLQGVGSKTQVLHLATHGDFNAENPLFSSLTMADKQLTTLDIFNLRLSASLVTLSACQTGRHVISRGDELLGLMRGFLVAGTASLVLTHWSVEDESTALLMTLFYQQLAQGMSKAAALRHAQQQLIRGSLTDETDSQNKYQHPYFWAPFFLMGHAGKL